jgi:hypothetical protein
MSRSRDIMKNADENWALSLLFNDDVGSVVASMIGCNLLWISCWNYNCQGRQKRPEKSVCSPTLSTENPKGSDLGEPGTVAQVWRDRRIVLWEAEGSGSSGNRIWGLESCPAGQHTCSVLLPAACSPSGLVASEVRPPGKDSVAPNSGVVYCSDCVSDIAPLPSSSRNKSANASEILRYYPNILRWGSPTSRYLGNAASPADFGSILHPTDGGATLFWDVVNDIRTAWCSRAESSSFQIEPEHLVSKSCPMKEWTVGIYGGGGGQTVGNERKIL